MTARNSFGWILQVAGGMVGRLSIEIQHLPRSTVSNSVANKAGMSAVPVCAPEKREVTGSTPVPTTGKLLAKSHQWP
jgi:hypothetical protein